jgi:hypothetical protein
MANHGHYLHQQFGWPVIVAVFAVTLVVYFAFATTGANFIATLLLLIPIAATFLFGSLRTEVDRTQLRIRFGIGLIRRSWELRDIASAEAVRNPWYTGWGIRYLPGVVVYNVSGFGAVEIRTHGGKRVRIGTNDPAGLERAIRARLK